MCKSAFTKGKLLIYSHVKTLVKLFKVINSLKRVSWLHLTGSNCGQSIPEDSGVHPNTDENILFIVQTEQIKQVQLSGHDRTRLHYVWAEKRSTNKKTMRSLPVMSQAVHGSSDARYSWYERTAECISPLDTMSDCWSVCAARKLLK